MEEEIGRMDDPGALARLPVWGLHWLEDEDYFAKSRPANSSFTPKFNTRRRVAGSTEATPAGRD